MKMRATLSFILASLSVSPAWAAPQAQAPESFSCFTTAPGECLKKGINLYPTRSGAECEAALLSSGSAALMARLYMLEKATKSIRVRALIFSADESGLAIARILKRKAAEGKSVVVMVDALSNLSLQAQWMYYDLRMAGVEVQGYELPWQVPVDKVLDLPRRNMRFHDKLLIIDAELPDQAMAIGGGMNMANEYFQVGGVRKRLWRDQDVAVRGQIVQDLTQSFDQDHAIFKADKERWPSLFNSDKTFPIWRKICNWVLSFVEKTIGIKTRIPFLENKFNRAEVNSLHEDAMKMEIPFKPAKARFIQSRPRFGETYIEDAYVQMIDSAVHEVYIANAYFVPTKRVREAMMRAVRERGVHVKIITNSMETNDLAPLSRVGRALYAELLSVNVPGAKGSMEIREYHGHRFLTTIHAKFMTVDGTQSIVGSFNLDPRSAFLNSETVIAFQDTDIALSLRKDFVEHDVPNSTKITNEQAQEFKSPTDITDKILLEISLPFEKQL